MTDIEPPWNPDAHWERVVRRGAAIRSRRRLALAACCVAALALLSVGVAAALGRTSTTGHRVAALGRRDTTSTAVGAAPSTTSLPIVSAIPAVPVTPATAPAATSTATATSIPHTATTRGVAHITIPATTTTVAPPACLPAELSFATVTDEPSYAVGASVAVALRVTNLSGRTCAGPSQSGIGAVGTITEGGVVVATTRGPAIACTNPCLAPVLAPGASTSYGAGEWSATAAGSYMAVASRTGNTGTPAGFTVTAG